MKVTLEVGEPRGFNAGDNGTNIIKGTLVEGLCGFREIEKEADLAVIIQTPKGEEPKAKTLKEYWLVVACRPVVYDDMRFSSLLFVPRYKVKKSPEEILAGGEVLVCNGIWRQDGRDWDAASIAAAQEGTIDVGGMLIASIKRAQE